MLRPTKHSHPDRTVIYASMIMLRELMSERIVNLESLKKHVSTEIDGGEFIFMPSLSLLFVFGLIHYHVKTDAIEYLGS